MRASAIIWIIACLLGAGVGAADAPLTVDAALKQVTRAMKGARGVVAEVEYAETVSNRPVNGSGKIYVHFDGVLRAEIAGDSPRTIILRWPYLYVHRHDDQLLEVSNVSSNPDLLGQYMMLGFVPAGKALKKNYGVQLVDDGMLDDKPALQFLITPKRKKSKDASRAIARIQLWVDPATGFPMQHKIVHSAGITELTIRYLDVSRNDQPAESLLRPTWPEEIKVIRR